MTNKKGKAPSDTDSRDQKENTDISKTGKLTPKGRPSLIREASPDDPIYTRGFMIGGRRSRGSSTTTPAATSPPENNNPEAGKPLKQNKGRSYSRKDLDTAVEKFLAPGGEFEQESRQQWTNTPKDKNKTFDQGH